MASVGGLLSSELFVGILRLLTQEFDRPLQRRIVIVGGNLAILLREFLGPIAFDSFAMDACGFSVGNN